MHKHQDSKSYENIKRILDLAPAYNDFFVSCPLSKFVNATESKLIDLARTITIFISLMNTEISLHIVCNGNNQNVQIKFMQKPMTVARKKEENISTSAPPNQNKRT